MENIEIKKNKKNTEANETKTLFSQLELTPEINKAIDDMGFKETTQIQAQAIPLMRTGCDMIGKSQTGTGKTVAFGIPAIQSIDTEEEKPTVQVLILCPTRELAQQGADELRKLAKYKDRIKVTEVYGGAPMDRQIKGLKKANIVIGTPGRVMDHLRRKTLKFFNLKTVILDEADEMLSMGFKEDIETILDSAPEERQTVLFSATMPKEILALTKKFQKSPQMIEIDKTQVTLDKITQNYIEVPMGRKKDALKLLLEFYRSKCTMIFCNTKRMVDELSEFLIANNFSAIGLHGDMKQGQRTTALNSFKHGGIEILVATDVAARGIDVNDIEYVINYDIPQSTEYYVHRIGRTGRAGKDGCAVTICSGRRQVKSLQVVACEVKSKIEKIELPTTTDIKVNSYNKNYAEMETILKKDISPTYQSMFEELKGKGFSVEKIAAAALQLHYGENNLADVESMDKKSKNSKSKDKSKTDKDDFIKLLITIGRSSHVAPNHIVGAITERTGLAGSEIGKIEIYDEKSIVSITSEHANDMVEKMVGCRICGKPVHTIIFDENFEDKKKIRTDNGDKKSDNYRKKSHSQHEFKGRFNAKGNNKVSQIPKDIKKAVRNKKQKISN